MVKFIQRAIDLCAWPGRIAALLIIPLTLAVLGSVAAAQFGLNEFLRWARPLPLIGQALTANALFDLQWIFMALIGLFGGSLALRDNQHVAVDFLSARFSERTRGIIQLLGDLFFLLPFCGLTIWYGTRFARMAYTSGERSVTNGLTDIWIVKSVIPIAFVLLALVAMLRIAKTLDALFRGAHRNREDAK